MKDLNAQLLDSVRKRFARRDDVEEKAMFNSLAFMVDGKMCVCVMRDGLLCRVGPEHYHDALRRDGCSVMKMGGRTMKDFVKVDEQVIGDRKDLDYWIDLCLDFNPRAKASRKKKAG